MSNRTLGLDDALYAYLCDASLREPVVMQRLREVTATLPEAGMQISPEQGQLMALLADLTGKGEIEVDALAAIASAPSRRYAAMIPIRVGRETVRLDVATIDWIDAAGDYMCLHAGGQTHVLRATMKELEEMLTGQKANASLTVQQLEELLKSMPRRPSGNGGEDSKKLPPEEEQQKRMQDKQDERKQHQTPRKPGDKDQERQRSDRKKPPENPEDARTRRIEAWIADAESHDVVDHVYVHDDEVGPFRQQAAYQLVRRAVLADEDQRAGLGRRGVVEGAVDLRYRDAPPLDERHVGAGGDGFRDDFRLQIRRDSHHEDVDS